MKSVPRAWTHPGIRAMTSFERELIGVRRQYNRGFPFRKKVSRDRTTRSREREA